MEPSYDIQVIINPASAAGRTSRRIRTVISLLERVFPGRCAFSLTRGPGDGIRLGARAVAGSAALIVAVGGDGTIHEVINGMMQAGDGIPRARLGILSSGSGQGFALSAGLPGRIEDQAGLLTGGKFRRVDLGVIAASGAAGKTIRRYFINESQIGIGAAVVARTTGLRKVGGGFLGYGLATISEILRCPNRIFRVTLDGRPMPPAPLIGLSVGNGARTGGGMSLTPAARIDDAHLDLLLIHGQSIPERLRSFPKIYSGAHVRTPGFSARTFTSLEARCEGDVPVAADGEIIGTLPSSIHIAAAAIDMILPTLNGA